MEGKKRHVPFASAMNGYVPILFNKKWKHHKLGHTDDHPVRKIGPIKPNQLYL